MSAVCLEVAREGPRSELELFTEEAAWTRRLLLAGWSRGCARLWLSKYGRRFACHRQRSDMGRQRTGRRFKGFVKAVGVHQARATKALVKLSAADAGPHGSALRDRPTVMDMQL